MQIFLSAAEFYSTRKLLEKKSQYKNIKERFTPKQSWNP